MKEKPDFLSFCDNCIRNCDSPADFPAIPKQKQKSGYQKDCLAEPQQSNRHTLIDQRNIKCDNGHSYSRQKSNHDSNPSTCFFS